MARDGVGMARVYDDPGPRDGTRVLVDRLWPRGLSKDRAHVDVWLKDVAPSKQLRTWYAHDPEKSAEFATRYRNELADDEHAAAVHELRELLRRGRVTLLTATRDIELSQVPVLVSHLEDRKE